MSAVVYARVPDSLKQALEAHASEVRLTLTAAVVDLLGRGLQAIANEQSVAELERKLAACSSERPADASAAAGSRAALAGGARAGADNRAHVQGARRAGAAAACLLPAVPPARPRR